MKFKYLIETVFNNQITCFKVLLFLLSIFVLDRFGHWQESHLMLSDDL